MRPVDSLPGRTLLRIVHHTQPADETGVEVAIDMAETGSELQACLRRFCHEAGVNEQKLAVLLTLLGFDPSPASLVDLGYHAGCNRKTLHTILEQFAMRH